MALFEEPKAIKRTAANYWPWVQEPTQTAILGDSGVVGHRTIIPLMIFISLATYISPSGNAT